MLTVPQALALAVQQHQAGQLEQAEQIYRAILQVQPQQVEALHLLGLVAYQVGQHEQARAYISQALRLKPDFVEAHNNLGAVLQKQGKLEEARACLQQALRLKPDHAKAHNNLGNVLRQQGQLAEAQACYQQALCLKPDYAEAHSNLGHVFQGQGQLAEAQACYEQALRYQPDFAEAHNNLGKVLHQRGQRAEAQACYQQALRLEPDYAEAHNNLGVALKEQGQLAQAQACYHQALLLEPGYAAAHNNLGNVLHQQGQLAEAQARYQQALHFKPDYVEAHINLGSVLQDQGRLAEAQTCYQQALCLQPDSAEAHWNRALAWLRAGAFEQGWPEYEWRGQCQAISLPRFPQPRWDGSPLHGQTILLAAEQGLGDTLHFIRYAPLVQAHGGCVLVACQPPLLPLVSRCPGIDRLLPLGSALPRFDVWAPLLSLPGLLRTTLATIPATVPYLFAEPQRVQYWQQELHRLKKVKIGIVWQGNPGHQNDKNRSVPLAQFEPLARVEGVHLISLQRGAGREQLETLAERFPVTDLGERLDEASLADAAAVLHQLDLLIACDTALAHLAGGMGLPVWLALPFNADWRWLRQREDSPWYPSMRLFRQHEWGNWNEVFARMAATLEQRLARGNGVQMDSYPGEED